MCCFDCAKCQEWKATLSGLDALWAVAVGTAKMELPDGVITKQELQGLVARYQRDSLCWLSKMVRNFVEDKMVSTMLRMMVDEEAEEVSGDESVDSFE